MSGELGPGKHDEFLDRGRGDDPHVDAFGASHGKRRDAGDVDVERAGSQRLDHVGAGFEGDELQIQPGSLRPSLPVEHDHGRGTQDRDDPNAQLLCRGCGTSCETDKRRGGEHRACSALHQEPTRNHGKAS